MVSPLTARMIIPWLGDFCLAVAGMDVASGNKLGVAGMLVLRALCRWSIYKPGSAISMLRRE